MAPVDSSQIDTTVNDVGTVDTAFDALARKTALCLYESDKRRDAIGAAAGIQASSTTNWINDETAFVLRRTLDRIEVVPPNQRIGTDRDEASCWLRWMRSMPCSGIADLSHCFRALANATLTQDALDLVDQNRQDFLNRIGCRLILLPSGTELRSPLTAPPASVVFGKLLYGGVTRSRLLASNNRNNNNPQSLPRHAGVRTEAKARLDDVVPCWMMYGGPARIYQAVDMGACAVLEVVLLPKNSVIDTTSGDENRNMLIEGFAWNPRIMFGFADTEKKIKGTDVASNGADAVNGQTAASLSGAKRNTAFRTDFSSRVGGLQPQIDSIVRRVLDGRVIRPAEEGSKFVATNVGNADGDEQDLDTSEDDTARQLAIATLEAEELSLLGLTPVKGLLLYGPPGCGTLFH